MESGLNVWIELGSMYHNREIISYSELLRMILMRIKNYVVTT